MHLSFCGAVWYNGRKSVLYGDFFMVYLFLAIASSVLVSVIMRLSSDRAKIRFTMLAANYLMCLAVAGCFTGFDALFPKADGLPATLGMGAVNGVLYLASFVIYQRSVRRCGVVLSSTFMKLGLLVPMAVSVLVFWELPSPVQAAGFVIAIVAIILINAGKAEGNFSLGLIALLIIGGGANAMSEVFEQIGPGNLSSQFLLYTFLTDFVLCCALVVLKKERPDWVSILFGLLIGVPNYFSARFLLLSLESVPAVIAHPTYSVVSVAAVSILGVCVFRERLKLRQWVAMAIIGCALILLNL